MNAQAELLVGTRKAAFIYTSDEKRRKCELSEPSMPGRQVFHMSADARSNPLRLYAPTSASVACAAILQWSEHS